jgi:hypothetical protein
MVERWKQWVKETSCPLHPLQRIVDGWVLPGAEALAIHVLSGHRHVGGVRGVLLEVPPRELPHWDLVRIQLPCEEHWSR